MVKLPEFQLPGVTAVVREFLQQEEATKTQDEEWAMMLGREAWEAIRAESAAYRSFREARDFLGRAEATAKGWAMVSVDFREPDVHMESVVNRYCACGEPYWTLRDRDDACCSRCREAKAPAYRALLVSSLEAEQREMPVNAFDRRAASEAWSAGVRAAVARLEEERKAADARRLGWDPELTGGEE